jgi:hypothetical protein
MIAGCPYRSGSSEVPVQHPTASGRQTQTYFPDQRLPHRHRYGPARSSNHPSGHPRCSLPLAATAQPRGHLYPRVRLISSDDQRRPDPYRARAGARRCQPHWARFLVDIENDTMDRPELPLLPQAECRGRSRRQLALYGQEVYHVPSGSAEVPRQPRGLRVPLSKRALRVIPHGELPSPPGLCEITPGPIRGTRPIWETRLARRSGQRRKG